MSVVLLVSSLFLCLSGILLGDVFLFFFFLSLSLFFWVFSPSGAGPGGKPKPPSRGFGVPLVFLRPDRDHVPRPVLQAPQLHPGHLPHFFFYPFVTRAGLWLGCLWVFGSRGGGFGSVCVSVGCFGRFWSCVCCSLAYCMYRLH